MTRYTIPYLNRLVGVCRGNKPPIGGPGYPIHPITTAIDPGKFTRDRIPDLHRRINAHRGDHRSVRGPGEGSYNVCMAHVS